MVPFFAAHEGHLKLMSTLTKGGWGRHHSDGGICWWYLFLQTPEPNFVSMLERFHNINVDIREIAMRIYGINVDSRAIKTRVYGVCVDTQPVEKKLYGASVDAKTSRSEALRHSC